MRVNQIWEVHWCHGDGRRGKCILVLAGNIADAEKKAIVFLLRRDPRAKVTGIMENGTIDVF